MDWKDFPFTTTWNGTNVEYRPMLEVTVKHKDQNIVVEGLVDSGCETSTVHTDIAKVLGVDLDTCERIEIGGVGGRGITGYLGPITFRINGLSYEYKTEVVFADIPAQLLLGQRGFFEHFKVHFERDLNIFRLGKFPSLNQEEDF